MSGENYINNFRSSPITYSWSQTSGSSVTLANATTTTPGFTPSTDGTYMFQLIINDRLMASAHDSVTISLKDTNGECLFNWAEKNCPYLFVPSGSPTLLWDVYTYHYYSTTNAYVGVSSADNHVYYMGADGLVLDVGALSHWLCL